MTVFDKRKKVLFLGGMSSGKTTIINILRNQNLDCINKIMTTTKKRWYEQIEIGDLTYYVWELPGNPYQKKKTILDSLINFRDAFEIIFLFDIQSDCCILEKEFAYFSLIIDILSSSKVKESLSKDFNLYILFHKYDPTFLHSKEIRKNIKYLSKEIKKKDVTLKYQLSRTSIYNFSNNYDERLVLESDRLGELTIELLSIR